MRMMDSAGSQQTPPQSPRSSSRLPLLAHLRLALAFPQPPAALAAEWLVQYRFRVPEALYRAMALNAGHHDDRRNQG